MPYDRKYRTTAYQRRSRKPPSARYKKKSYKKSAPRYKGTGGAPRRQITKRKIVAALNSIAETKLVAFSHENARPRPFSTDTRNYQLSFNLGNLPLSGSSSSFPSATGLNLFNVLQANRDGEYIYLKRNSTKMEIKMNPIDYSATGFDASVVCPYQFRMLILKPNAKYLNNGISPTGSCFLDEAGVNTGYNSPRTFSNLALASYITNKREFLVLRDQRFTLSPPSVTTNETVITGTGTGFAASLQSTFKYPTFKRINISTPVNKKTHYTSGAEIPTDYQDSTFVIIMASPLGALSSANPDASQWTMDILSTTSYTDM